MTVKELLEKALIENFGEVRSAKVVQEGGVSITVEEKGRERRISCVSRGFFDVVNLQIDGKPVDIYESPGLYRLALAMQAVRSPHLVNQIARLWEKADEIVKRAGEKNKKYEVVKLKEPVEWTFWKFQDIEGDEVIYEPETVKLKRVYRCPVCGLVWPTRWQARDCAKNLHLPLYEKFYGLRVPEPARFIPVSTEDWIGR